MRVRIADDFGAIRESMLALYPKAPAIVHPGNLMPISSAHAEVERYCVTIEYPLWQTTSLKFWRNDDVEASPFSRKGVVLPREQVIRTPTMPRMTIKQIDHWNFLRSHTGMKLRVVL